MYFSKKLILENSFRTNCNMAKAMCKLKLTTLANKYLKDARKDKKMLDELKRTWELDATKTLV